MAMPYYCPRTGRWYGPAPDAIEPPCGDGCAGCEHWSAVDDAADRLRYDMAEADAMEGGW